MTDQPQLHSSIVAMISLASGIASRHPDMGLCQLERLRNICVPEHQIDAVIEIARHIRDEASGKVDAAFDEKAQLTKPVVETEASDCCGTGTATTKFNSSDDCETMALESASEESCGCTPTPGGQSCC